MIDRRLFRYFDKGLVISILAVLAIGIMAIYSATHSRGLEIWEGFMIRQLIFAGVGLLIMLIVVSVSYQKFIDISYAIYAINIVLLILVLVIGHVRLGAQRWFSIAGFAFQPSEFIKLSLILAFANCMGSRRDSISSIPQLVVPSLILSFPFALVLLQPDLGTALLLIPIFFAMLIVAGARPKHVLVMITSGILLLPVFWHFLRAYQKQRLLVFINPNVDPLGAGYTIIQSKIAVGSGGFFGKGWLGGTQNQLNFLPERHTDFIFSVIGEEWGFLGAMLLMLLYILIIKKAFSVAALTNDRYGRLIATGIAVMFSFQITINIAMTIGLMPVVGIPLPLVSYGGSSLITTFAAAGLLLNIGMRRSKF